MYKVMYVALVKSISVVGLQAMPCEVNGLHLYSFAFHLNNVRILSKWMTHSFSRDANNCTFSGAAY